MKFSEITNNIKEVEQQKDLSKSLLSEVNEFFDYALVAGGAPRNWTFGRPANDIDIYVLRKVDHNNQKAIDKKVAEGVKTLSAKYGLGENRASRTINSNVYGGFILNSLYDFKAPLTISVNEDGSVEKKDQDCQLIIIDDLHAWDIDCVKNLESFSKRIFSTYDFGICKTSVDKDGNIYNDPMFDSDIKNKTFTCNIREFKRNNTAGLKKLVERFEKMERYFPDHKMRVVH